MELISRLLETKGVGMSLPSSKAGFGLGEAYQAAHDLHKAQLASGKTLAGRKIGISNRAAWENFGLNDVVWGYVYSDTVFQAQNNSYTLSLEGLPQPKLEPEIVFGLKDDLPLDTRNPEKLLKSVAWMALGFEVVQCPYPDWKFKPADLVATFGFHGALIVGDKVEVEPYMAAAFASCKASLKKEGVTVAEGGGTNVVDSPAVALGHLADLIHNDAGAAALKAEELVTTGTLTAAPSVAAGETYQVTVTGLGLPKLSVTFS